MKTCSHCGTQNKDDAQKCVRCGLEMLAKGASKIGTMKSIVEARRFKTMTESFLRGIGAVEGKDALFPFQIDTTVEAHTQSGYLQYQRTIPGRETRLRDAQSEEEVGHDAGFPRWGMAAQLLP